MTRIVLVSIALLAAASGATPAAEVAAEGIVGVAQVLSNPNCPHTGTILGADDVDGWPQDAELDDGTPIIDALSACQIVNVEFLALEDDQKEDQLNREILPIRGFTIDPASACTSNIDCAKRINKLCEKNGGSLVTHFDSSAFFPCTGVCKDGTSATVRCVKKKPAPQVPVAGH